MDIIISASRKQIITLTCISKGSEEWRFWIRDIQYDSFSSVEMACGRWRQEKAGGGTEPPLGSEGRPLNPWQQLRDWVIFSFLNLQIKIQLLIVFSYISRITVPQHLETDLKGHIAIWLDRNLLCILQLQVDYMLII